MLLEQHGDSCYSSGERAAIRFYYCTIHAVWVALTSADNVCWRYVRIRHASAGGGASAELQAWWRRSQAAEGARCTMVRASPCGGDARPNDDDGVPGPAVMVSMRRAALSLRKYVAAAIGSKARQAEATSARTRSPSGALHDAGCRGDSISQQSRRVVAPRRCAHHDHERPLLVRCSGSER